MEWMAQRITFDDLGTIVRVKSGGDRSSKVVFHSLFDQHGCCDYAVLFQIRGLDLRAKTSIPADVDDDEEEEEGTIFHFDDCSVEEHLHKSINAVIEGTGEEVRERFRQACFQKYRTCYEVFSE
jgi:hypothetical protein